jgi:hypothetical protein
LNWHILQKAGRPDAMLHGEQYSEVWAIIFFRWGIFVLITVMIITKIFILQGEALIPAMGYRMC